MLKAPMQSCSKNRDRTAVGIKRRVLDKLVIESAVESFPDLKIVVRLEDLFPAVGERAVACENAESTILKE